MHHNTFVEFNLGDDCTHVNRSACMYSCIVYNNIYYYPDMIQNISIQLYWNTYIGSFPTILRPSEYYLIYYKYCKFQCTATTTKD